MVGRVNEDRIIGLELIVMRYWEGRIEWNKLLGC